MGEIQWKKRDISRIFNITELFSTMAIYEEFKRKGDDYLDDLRPNELRLLFVRELDAESISSQAMNTLHRLFDNAVEDFSSFLKHPEEFKNRVEQGTKDPVRKLTEEDMFINALKFVLVYRIATERKTTLTDAKKERARIMGVVSDNCRELLMGIVVTCAESLMKAAQMHDLDGDDISRITLRIEDVFEDGLATRICLDGEPLDYNDDLGDLLKKDKVKEPEDSFNPMFG